MEIVKSKNDLFRIIDHADQKHTSKILLFMILGTIFLDAYDITILGTMTDQLTKQFHLSPTMLSVVMTSLPIGALLVQFSVAPSHINLVVNVFYPYLYLFL